MYVYYSIEVAAPLQALEVVIVPRERRAATRTRRQRQRLLRQPGLPDGARRREASRTQRKRTRRRRRHLRITRGTHQARRAARRARRPAVLRWQTSRRRGVHALRARTGFEASKYHIVAYDVSDPKDGGPHAGRGARRRGNVKSLGDGESPSRERTEGGRRLVLLRPRRLQAQRARNPDARPHCRADVRASGWGLRTVDFVATTATRTSLGFNECGWDGSFRLRKARASGVARRVPGAELAGGERRRVRRRVQPSRRVVT